MRVLFVYPNIDCPPGINHGIAAMSGVLKARGHEVGLIHVCDNLWELPTTDEVLERINEFRPDIVGFSAMSQQYRWCCEVSRVLRTRRPDLPQAIGGVHCTMVPDDVTADELWDWVFVGECDEAFAELVDRMRDGGDLCSVPNTRICPRFSPTDETIRNAVGPFPDLATLQETDYELFDIDHIVSAKNGWMGLITSRGCPYKCTGGIYETVPTIMPSVVSRDRSMATAKPKSPILATPSPVSHTLPGFKSRWTMPRLWANSRPRQVSLAMSMACSRGSRWSGASSITPSTSPPPISSVTM